VSWKKKHPLPAFSFDADCVLVITDSQRRQAATRKELFMIGSDIPKLYNQTKWALILRGLLSLAVAVAIFWRPMASVASLALVIALWSLFDGMVNIVRSFNLRGIAQHWWVVLLSGIVGVAFGTAALYYFPGLSLAFAVTFTAYWLTVSGLMSIYVSWQERGAGLSWGWTMVFGIVAIAGGVIAFMNPLATLATLLGVIAGFALIAAAVLFIGAGRMIGFQQDVRNVTPNPARA
jgi:uncharacterized membrane protein HdeD (DUF308 family)